MSDTKTSLETLFSHYLTNWGAFSPEEQLSAGKQLVNEVSEYLFLHPDHHTPEIISEILTEAGVPTDFWRDRDGIPLTNWESYNLGVFDIICKTNASHWYFNGGETVEMDGRRTCFTREGLNHRDDNLPAVLYSNRKKEWYQHGNLHRENDQPAVIYVDANPYASGSTNKQEWYRNGKRHRDPQLGRAIEPGSFKSQPFWSHWDTNAPQKPQLYWVDGEPVPEP